MTEKQKYTQRDWDRTVGYGKVPPEYMHDNAIVEALEGGDTALWEQLWESQRERIRKSMLIPEHMLKNKND